MTRTKPRPVLESVVKVLAVSDAPDYEQPWQTHGAAGGSGSGAIVETKRGLRVLTNAHVVQNQVFVEVRRYGSAQKSVAEVEGVGHDCDLALLRIKDRAFFQDAKPIAVADLPQLSDRVTVAGYPIGGDRLSVTEGIVSRIEVFSYAQTQRPLLGIQIDAAVNSGNSGGPVFYGDRLAGIAFQALEEGQNISYAIAPSVVSHFLVDMENGKFEGFPELGIWWQRLESDAHRRMLGLKRVDGGVLVRRIAFEASAWGVLEPGDVMLEIDGTKVEADGTVPLRQGERIEYSHLVSQRFVGDRVNLTIARDRKKMNVAIELAPPKHLVPEDRYDVRPTYYIFGGLLFAPLTRDYLKSWGGDWWKSAPHDLITHYDAGIRSPDRIDLVVLQKVLADKVNQGYHDFENLVVAEIDGVPVRGMKDLVERIEQSDSRFLRVTTTYRREIVIDRKEAEARAEIILEKYNVPRDRSPDLRRRAPRARKKTTQPSLRAASQGRSKARR